MSGCEGVKINAYSKLSVPIALSYLEVLFLANYDFVKHINNMNLLHVVCLQDNRLKSLTDFLYTNFIFRI